MQLSYRVIFGLVLGICLGLILKYANNFTIITETINISKKILFLIGHGYLALLKMLVIPLILTSIIHAIVNINFNNDIPNTKNSDSKNSDTNAKNLDNQNLLNNNTNANPLKIMSIASCAMLLSMTALSSLIGIAVGEYFNVGNGLLLPDVIIEPQHHYQGLTNTLLGFIPSNPIAVMAQENTIAIMLFAILIAIAARTLDKADHDKMQTFTKLIASLFAIVKKLAALVISITPFGIFALMALLVFDQGFLIFTGMFNFIIAMYIAMLIVFCMHLLILLSVGIFPWDYFKKAYIPLLVAFTTRSSFGTLPASEETLRNQFKTKQIVASFVPSIGATMGMNACAGVFPAMLVVMTMTILHHPLTWQIVLLVMAINSIASLGISGIPGTAYIAASITLTSLHLPYGVVALVQGIDPLVDMGRTATNVNGVLTTALVVDLVMDKKGGADAASDGSRFNNI